MSATVYLSKVILSKQPDYGYQVFRNSRRIHKNPRVEQTKSGTLAIVYSRILIGVFFNFDLADNHLYTMVYVKFNVFFT